MASGYRLCGGGHADLAGRHLDRATGHRGRQRRAGLRLPHYIFSNDSKHSDGDTPDYSRELEVACQTSQLAHRRLLAKKGDVFFWTADLVHRSHPLVLPSDTSRLSCVTHYCPATSMPHWFREPDKRGIEPYWDVGGFASSFYTLPNVSQMVRPVPRWEFYN